MEHIAITPEQFKKPTSDYLRVMTASPEVNVADIPANVSAITHVVDSAKDQGAELVVLPELGLTAYSAADLLYNDYVLEQTTSGLIELAEATVDGPAVVVGAPIEDDGILYNCGVVLGEGKIKGIVPKSYLPNYGEFYEKRWFTSGKNTHCTEVSIGEQVVPFGTDLLFDINGTKVGVEICEDAWAPITPSAYATLGGAEVIANLSASNDLVGKTEYRRDMITGLAAKLMAGYVYTSAGAGESNADVVYGGHQMIAENGRIVQETLPHDTNSLAFDIDRTELTHERRTNKTWADQAEEVRAQRKYRVIPISATAPDDASLLRPVDAHPFVPQNPEVLDERCEQIFQLMAESLAARAKQSNAQAIVLGLSGGLDSTLALLTAVQASKILKKPNGFVHTITMPGPASSNRTQDNASLLAEALGTTHKQMPITSLSGQTLETIGHDGQTEDITYENTQARMRTLLLMNYANMVGGFVEGTGDMSETAQGWCTYNGDHMSMYNPNASIPKTLVKHLVSWVKDNQTDKAASQVLEDILDTPISPELTGNGDLSQETEDTLGPYELHDFFLYHLQRKGERPAKIGYLALQAFKDSYTADEVAHWLNSFLTGHVKSQWKREAVPNGPKVGTVSMSPRGDLRMAPNTSVHWFE